MGLAGEMKEGMKARRLGKSYKREENKNTVREYEENVGRRKEERKEGEEKEAGKTKVRLKRRLEKG